MKTERKQKLKWIFNFIDGFSYEREALEEWFERGKYTSPMTNLDISPEVKRAQTIQ